MSYGARHTAYYTSPMRDRKSYYIVIYEDGYGGDRTELYLKPDGLTLTWGRRDGGELEPILPSELQLKLQVLSNPETFRELYTTDPRKFQIVVAEDSRAQMVTRWVGYISTGEYSQPFANPPFEVVIRANDGFEILRNLPYEASRGVRFTGVVSLRDLVERLLAPLGSAQVRIWGMDGIDPLQSGETPDLIGLSDDGIYATFDNGTPSYYDVLDSVLRNYGLQLYQSLGKWNVRPIFALAEKSRPAWFDTSFSALGMLARNRIYPLLGPGDGVGMSTSAVLSMRAPMREMSVEEPASTSEFELRTMLQPKRWLTRNITETQASSWRGTYVGVGTSGIRMCSYDVTLNHYTAWLGYAFDGVFAATSGSSLTLSANLYNLRSAASQVRASIFAVPSDIDPLGWLIGEITGPVTIPEGVWSYSSDSVWEDVGGTSGYVMDTLYHTSIDLEAGKKNIPFAQKVSLGRLTEQGWDIEIKGIPAISNNRYARLVLVVTTKKNVLTAFELADPRVTIEYDSAVVEIPAPNAESVSNFGADTVSFERRFAELGLGAVVGGAFATTSVRIANERAIRGFVAPTDRMSLTGVVASRLRVFRGGVTQCLEGELYCPVPFDFDTLWEDDEGKLYYATYIQEIASRGLHKVQLYELPSYREVQRRFTILEENALTAESVSFDTTILYLSGSRLLMLDIITEDVTLLAEFEGAVWMTQGVEAACIVQELDGIYHLYAYDALGTLLSEVHDMYASVTEPGVGPQIVARNAVYDRAISTWTIIGNVDATSDKVQITTLDGNGAQLLEEIQELGRIVGRPRAFAGGFALSATRLTESSPRVWWHSYLTEEALACTSPLAGATLKDVNDVWLVVELSYDGSTAAYARDGMSLGSFAFRSTSAYVANNNALFLLRSGVTFEVLDMRRAPAERHSAPAIATALNLAGDKVVWQQGTVIVVYNPLAE